MVDTALTGPRDIKVISLIGFAHGTSHFYQLVLPMLFPALIVQFNVDYTMLGAMMTTLWVVSALCQTAAGFMVDRFGARVVLFAGVSILGAVYAAMSLATHFWMLFPLAALAGVANSVFHPADYSILTHRVNPKRIGRAYSVHTFGGTLGLVCAPPVVIALEHALGWRGALGVLGLFGFALLALLALNASEMPNHGRAEREAAGDKSGPVPIAVLLSAPILMCFAYFTMISIASGPLQAFMPTTLTKLHGLSLGLGGTVLSTYLVCGATGILIGGWIADRGFRPDLIVATGLGTGAVLIALVGFLPLPVPALFVLLGIASLFISGTLPSRDLLVRGAAPPGATGRVFGLVYSGLDVGSAIGPLVAGHLLDIGRPDLLLYFVAVVLLLGVGSAVSVRQLGRA